MRSGAAGLALVAVACGANRIPVDVARPHASAPSQIHSSVSDAVPSKRPALDHAALLRASCDRTSTSALPVAAPRDGSSSVAIAYAGDDTLAYVADADSRSIHTVALSGKELSRTELDASPRQLVLLGDGRVVATLSDAASIEVLEPSSETGRPMTVLCERALPAEPWAMATDDKSLLVTSTFGAALSAIDLATFATRRTVALPRDPRSVIIDGSRAFVSHSVGAKVSVVDLATEAAPTEIALGMRKRVETPDPLDKTVIRTASHGFALARVGRRLLLPMTTVAQGRFDADAPATRSYYGQLPDGVPKQAPTVMVIDGATRTALSKDILGTTTALYTRECLLPRAATVSDTTLFVACAGIDAVLELDASAVDPMRAERARFKVPSDPEGLAVDARGKRLVVFSQIGGTLTVLPIGSRAERATTIALDYEPTPALAAIARGRKLFFRTDDDRIANDGVACASCHIDGRDDGITWTTPIGPRQTPMLVGRVVGTAPFGWEGDQATLSDYIFHTVINLGGKGLPEGDRADLAAYLEHAAAPVRPAVTPNARGAELFASTGCTTCHAGGSTDGEKHPFGTVTGDSLSDGTNTPTLRFVAGTAPYFHDGRYATIESLLADKKSHMGTSASLSDADRRTLASYLRSL
jgi:DNA-binding beta-propeller fold protein YncE